MFSLVKKGLEIQRKNIVFITSACSKRGICRIGVNGIRKTSNNATLDVFKDQTATSINPYTIMQYRNFSSKAIPIQVNRDRFKKMFISLQSGRYADVIKEAEACYASHFSLPPHDVYMVVSRLEERKEWLLISRVLQILEKYDSDFLLSNAPLFCYALLLNDDIKASYALVSSTSDKYLSQKIETKKRSSPALLPQEYLFVRICIQLMSDIKGLGSNIVPFSQSLPRRGSMHSYVALHALEVIPCYVYTWKYLLQAMKKSQQNSTTTGINDQENMDEFFASPYVPAAGSSRSLQDCEFSSITLHQCSQRLESTLRSLELLLWYVYSRSVFDPKPTMLSNENISVSSILENAYTEMTENFDFWNSGIFQFFIFYYAQPIAEIANGKRVQRMRDKSKVCELLDNAQQQQIPISKSLAMVLFSKSELALPYLEKIMSTFVNSDLSQSQLLQLSKENADLLEEYVKELGKRNEGEALQRFYKQLLYLNVSCNSELFNEILLMACYTKQDHLIQDVMRDMNNKGIPMNGENMASLVYVHGSNGKDVKEVFQQQKWKENKDWDMWLCHILYQFKLSKIENASFSDICNENRVSLDGDHCCRLFDYYIQQQDYQNCISLYHTIQTNQNNGKSENMNSCIEASKMDRMKDIIGCIEQSKSYLFGLSILGKLDMMNLYGLKRQGNRFKPDCVDESMQRALCLFKKDSKLISINRIMNSVVKDFCEQSIQNFGYWI